MRTLLASFFLLGVFASAQTPDPSKVQLFGDRFKPLKYEEMTPEQKTMINNLLTGERAGTGGPFNVLLRSPEMGDLAQKLGAQARFHSELPDKLKELSIIMVAQYWKSQYEWQAHKRAALQAGLKPAIVDAITVGKRPAGMDREEEIVYNFASELLNTHEVSDATYKAVKDAFGEKRVVNMIGIMGYYGLVSMLLNVDRYPLPEGAKPELK